MIFTVEELGAERSYESKFGPMRSYKVKFKESTNWVDVNQKQTTLPPVIGQTMEGDIDLSGQYGPKFKKAYGGGGAIAPARGAKTEFDSFTMYLSYAKDLVVALQSTEGFDKEKFAELLEATAKGGHALYSRRPGANPTGTNPEPDKDTEPEDPFDE